MSTTTRYCNFIKPELSDSADITAYNRNWDWLDNQMLLIGTLDQPIAAYSIDGVHYDAGLASDFNNWWDGMEITIYPDMTNTSAAPVIRIGVMEYTPIRLPLSTNTSATIPVPIGFLVKDCAIKLRYDIHRNSWIIVDKEKTSASDLYGSVPITNGGHGGKNAEEARANLEITPANIGALPSVLVEGEHYGTLEQRPAAGTKGRFFCVLIEE